MKILLIFVLLLISVAGFSQHQVQNETAGALQVTSEKVKSLVQAIPADKMDWAPAEGVRSFKSVLIHIASANYFFATKLGAELPEGVNPRGLDESLKTKEDVVNALEESYELALAAIKNAKEEELGNKVEYPFPGDFTNMTTMLIILSHTNEHLGQLIAYARMNDITPPWSE